MGFKDYYNSNNIQEEKLKKESKKVEELYNQYKDMSQDELTKELYKYVAKQKKDGTFNIESLTTMLNNVAPFLTPEQQIKMKGILDSLK